MWPADALGCSPTWSDTMATSSHALSAEESRQAKGLTWWKPCSGLFLCCRLVDSIERARLLIWTAASSKMVFDWWLVNILPIHFLHVSSSTPTCRKSVRTLCTLRIFKPSKQLLLLNKCIKSCSWIHAIRTSANMQKVAVDIWYMRMWQTHVPNGVKRQIWFFFLSFPLLLSFRSSPRSNYSTEPLMLRHFLMEQAGSHKAAFGGSWENHSGK